MPILRTEEEKKLKIRFIPDIQAFEAIPLPNKDGQTTTRKVIKAEFINPNPQNPNAPLKISLCHQKKKPNGEYEDCESLPLSSLKAGQEVRMILDSEQTLALNTVLNGLFDYCKKNLGVLHFTTPRFTLEKVDEVVKVAPERKAVIQKLVDGNYENEFWEELEKINPNGATKLSYARIFTIRNEALQEFRKHLIAKDWDETQWQAFFENNTWIFGYGLSFKWLSPIGKKLEQTTTGAAIDSSGKRPDAFVHTVAEIATTAFVDIKTPQTPLLDSKEYRPEVFPASYQLAGGVSQVQVTIEKWLEDTRHNVLTIKDKDGFTKNDPIFSYQPKGILVAGTLGQFKKDAEYHEAKVYSFELLRRQITNPEIITFDELYYRAKHIISNVTE